jgi:hypothetical protein
VTPVLDGTAVIIQAPKPERELSEILCRARALRAEALDQALARVEEVTAARHGEVS